MLGNLLRTVCVILVYAAITGAAAWTGSEIVPRVIRTCTGPGVDCGYSEGLTAVLIYHPLMWFAGFMFLLATRKWRLLSVFEGRWVYLIAPAILALIYAAFFMLFLL